MKLLLFACFLSMMGGTSTTPTNVYATAKGSKYHTHKDCRYLKGKDVKTISLIQAKADGKTLCKVCQVKDILNK